MAVGEDDTVTDAADKDDIKGMGIARHLPQIKRDRFTGQDRTGEACRDGLEAMAIVAGEAFGDGMAYTTIGAQAVEDGGGQAHALGDLGVGMEGVEVTAEAIQQGLMGTGVEIEGDVGGGGGRFVRGRLGALGTAPAAIPTHKHLAVHAAVMHIVRFAIQVYTRGNHHAAALVVHPRARLDRPESTAQHRECRDHLQGLFAVDNGIGVVRGDTGNATTGIKALGKYIHIPMIRLQK